MSSRRDKEQRTRSESYELLTYRVLSLLALRSFSDVPDRIRPALTPPECLCLIVFALISS